MNLPNKLTILRTLMIPVFLFFLLTDCAGDYSKWIAVVVFILASLTDFLDGHIARKYNLVTNFGKFMDPLADKLLVCSAMIALVGMHRLSSIVAIIIIAREFIISGFRLIASDNGIVIAASYWGKFKTNFQMFMIIMLIIDLGTTIMTAEIICVGTEILLGNIVNTNAAYLSERLASLGISVFFETTVGDNPERLENVIRQGLERSDILILSGGLGPTKDDLTKEIATKACGQELVEDEEALRRLKEYFARSHRNMTENNLKQALVPEDCTVLYNENGTAPGMVIHAKEGKKVVLLPGPPNELLPMFHDQVEPIIKELSSEVLYSDVVKIDCMGESRVAAEIEDLIEKQTNPTVAPYAKLGEVHLRVTAKAVSEDEAKKLVTPITEELYRRFGHKIFTTKEDETLEDVVVDMLSKHHYTIAAAESCTAGMFTARLVNVAGASDVLNESFITYANEAKMKYLGVKEETLNTVGAVSEDTARQMAEGVARQAGSNVGVGITGLAGPGGETPEKKAGLVYIGVSVNGKTKVNKYQLNGNRQKVRETAVCRALTMVRHALVEEFL